MTPDRHFKWKYRSVGSHPLVNDDAYQKYDYLETSGVLLQFVVHQHTIKGVLLEDDGSLIAVDIDDLKEMKTA